MKRKFSILFAALAAILLITPPHFITKAQGQTKESITVSYGWEDNHDATPWTITTEITKTSGQGNSGDYAGRINTNNTYVQFNEQVFVESFSFSFKRTSKNTNYEVYIETSSDGINWYPVETYPMGDFGNGTYTTKSHVFDGTTKYYVRFHCYNTTAIRYIDDVTITYKVPSSSPTIKLSETELSDFSYFVGYGPSEAKNFTLQGSNLNEKVTLSAQGDYEISKTLEDGYLASLEYEINDIAEAQTVYVRLKAGLNVGVHNGTITASSTGAEDKTITLSGEVSQAFNYNLVLQGSHISRAALKVGGTELQENDKIQSGKEVTVVVEVEGGYTYSVSVTTAEGTVDVINDKFTMPASDITVTVTERVNPFICATLDSETMMQFIPNTEKEYGYGYIKHVTSDGLLWVTNGYFQTNDNKISLGMIQLRTKSNSNGVSYIKLPEFEGRIEKIVFSVTNASASEPNSITTPNKLYFQETATKDGEIIAQGGGDNTNSITISLSDKVYNTGYILASGGIRIWNIEVTYTPYYNFIQYDDNTPLPSEIPAGENISISNNANMEVSELTIPSTSTVVVTSGSILNVTSTLTNHGSANNLIIEDGGQLIVNNNGVMATFKKSIEAATPTAKTTEGGWYSIASPVNNVAISSVTNLVNNAAGTLYYNLYRYDEPSSVWQAYNTTEHEDFTTLANGQGYLYRNNGMELSFSGEVNHGDVVVNLTNRATNNELKGFNLIGNPFGHNIYKGSGAAIDNNNLSEGFYYLTYNGEWQAGDGSKAITPKMGVLVQVTGEAFELTISDKNNSPTNTRYANDNLQFIVSNNEYQDVAYAKFSKGYGLNKISHRNSEVPMLYIPQNGERYAIAMMSDNTEMFALNFKAATMGRYTLSYKAEGEFSYLHVIDRLTGDDVDMLLEGEYSFTASPKDNESRFIVRLAYKPDYSNEGNEMFVYQNGDEILVSGEGELQVFDATGRLVRNMSINGAKSLNISTQGVYIFRLVGNEVKTQKIVVR